MTEAFIANRKTGSSRKRAEGRLFVLELSGGRIHSMSPEGGDRKVIVADCRHPDGIAVDVAAGHIYWTNMGVFDLNDGSIERADIDGNNRKVIVPEGSTFSPKQILLDKKNGKLYWCDREGMRVMRSNLDGSQIETLIEAGRGDADRRDRPDGVSALLSTRNGGRSTGRRKARPKEIEAESSAPALKSPRAKPPPTAPTSKYFSIACRSQSTSSSI
jgi:hypothetical protein